MSDKKFLKGLLTAWKPYIKVCLSGALLAFAFPPFQLGFVACFGLIPFLYWSNIEKKSDAFKTGYWWGFGFHTAGLYWIINSTVLGGIAALLFLPLFSAVTLLLCRFFFQRVGRPGLLWLFPFLWTAMEYFRTVGVLGFPWMSIAYSQTYYPTIIQYSEYTGVHGVVFWICVLNVFAFLIIEHIRSYINEGGSFINAKSALLVITPVFLIIVPIIHGYLSIRSGSYIGESIKVSLIQGHVDMDQKTDAEFTRANFKNYETLSLKAAETKPDLIVWPETATATWLRSKIFYRRWFRNIVKTTGSSLLSGSLDYIMFNDGTYNAFNSALLMNRPDENFDRDVQWYAKMRLVPFGEWFPYEDRIPWIEKIDFGQANFKPGKEHKILYLEKRNSGSDGKSTPDETIKSDTLKLNAAVCFESIFPDFIRTFCNKGSQLMVVVSNVNWFGKTTSLYQHARIGVFRAIENRIGVAHCSNSGISMIIDPYGRVTAESGVFVKEILNGKVNYFDSGKRRTFYTRNGELLSRFSLLVSLICFIACFFRKNSLQ